MKSNLESMKWLVILYTFIRSIERYAQHEAKRTEQEARGLLERQKLQNEMVINKFVSSTQMTLNNSILYTV